MGRLRDRCGALEAGLDVAAEILSFEEQLRDAMLDGDVAQLDRLLSDDLVFTNQAGVRLTKADDLAAHRSGLLAIDSLAERAPPVVRAFADVAAVCATVAVAGAYDGQPFSGTFAYSRLWRRTDGRWQVELAHCSGPVAG